MRLLLVMLALLVAACIQANTPVSQGPTSNTAVPVSLLFEHNGVSVYRFIDAGRYHYYVVQGTQPLSMFHEWSQQCGKNCTTVVLDEIPTVVAR